MILALALFLLFAIPHIRMLQIPALASYSFVLKYIGFPIIAGGLSIATSITCQKIACGTTDIGAVWSGLQYFMALLLGGLLLGNVAYLRAPIVSLFAMDERLSGILAYEREVPFLKGLAQGYWIFFATLVGQILAGSMSVVC